jgi:phosphate transport system substrate-binding protein
MTRLFFTGLVLVVTASGMACGRTASSEPVVIDGSSTVFPLSEAMAHHFLERNSGARVTVTYSGTDTGFEKFCRGAIDIVDASRPITAGEQAVCAASKVEFIELPVARDAITVIVNGKNSWAESMTVAELRALWAPEADKKVTRWSQVRTGWPDREITLFGPGAESGTFDYFTAAINGGARASRRDYMASGDDSTIVNGVSADEFALGYVGYGYYERAKDRLKSVAIDDGDDSIGQGAIQPSPQNVGRGVYRPLSRILFIYVNNARVERPEVRALVDDYLRHAGERAAQVGTIALMSNVYDLARQRFTKRRTGTMYGSPSAAELGIEYLLTQ